MATEFSETTFRELDDTIKASQEYRPSKVEKRLNDIGTSVLHIANSPFAAAVKSDIATETFPVIKDLVKNLAQHSKELMFALDEVAKVHPFIQVAVLPFKIALELELNRRYNDQEVAALINAMCDTMDVLRLLKLLVDPKAPGADGLTIEDRLQRHMNAIADTIKHCCKVCECYHQRHTAVKFFTSIKWKGKFVEIAQKFADHKSEIRLDLQMHTSLVLTSVAANVSQVNENLVKVVEEAFKWRRTPEERKLSSLVDSQPGGMDAVLNDDRLLEQVLAKSQKSGKDVKAGMGGKYRKPHVSWKADGKLSITELRREIKKDVEQVLADNTAFEGKFDMMRRRMDEVKEMIRHGTDRILDAIHGGPHEHIVDRDLYHIWKEMGWRGSVKARHLVMAVRDHFGALAEMRDTITNRANNDSPDAAARIIGETAEITDRADPNVLAEDQWALQYITVLRAQPLIEALDDDASSFVTIAEVNAFTKARPLTWSLPHWIAYWTYGFEATVQWYFRRIRKIMFEINKERCNILPANRKILNDFTCSGSVSVVEDLLSGLRNVDDWDDTDWDSDATFRKFKDHVMETELRMERALQEVRYYVDAANTLRMVTGEGRPEKYTMPILFLLFRRSLWIIRQARTVTLHPEELGVVQSSLWKLLVVILDRVRILQAVCRLQNVDKTEHLGKFFYGLYSYATEYASIESPYWARSPDRDTANLPDNEDEGGEGGDDSEGDAGDHDNGRDTDDDNEHDDGNRKEESASTTNELPLFYGPQIEDLDLITDHISYIVESSNAPTVHSLIGLWSGSYNYDNGKLPGDGLVSFTITSHNADGIINGSGMDALGPFTVQGKLEEGGRLSFQKEYQLLQYGMKTIWRYEGIVAKGLDEIKGMWGPTDAEWSFEPESEGAGDQKGAGADLDIRRREIRGEEQDPLNQGTFSLKRRPVEYILSCPPDEEFKTNRIRALWKLALNATLLSVRSREMNWELIAARRRQRQRYIELIKLKETWYLDSDAAQEWAELIKVIHPHDLHVWRCVAMFQMRREVVHNIICDACGAVPLESSRFICIDCSADEINNSIDLCSDCFHTGKRCTRDAKVHTPDHSVLQLRSIHWRSYRHPMFSDARERLSQAEDLVSQSDSDIDHLADEDSPTPNMTRCCVGCKKPIESRPFWCCLDCRAMTVVCYECNKRTEQEKAWLFEWRPNPDYSNKHDWSHTLVSAPLPKGDSNSLDPEILFTEVRQRLAGADKQLMEVNTRMEKLEKLLEQLLNGKS